MKKFIPAVILIISCQTLFAQQSNQIPREEQIGPKGTDYTQASSIYVIRQKDEFPKMYFGLGCEDFGGLLAKVRSEEIYEIRTVKNGKFTLLFRTDSTFKQELVLSPYSKSYLELKVGYSHTGTPVLKFNKLDSIKALEIINNHPKKIQVNYSTIGYSNAEHIASFKLDSIPWFADETHHFSTIIPKSTDGYAYTLYSSLNYFSPFASKTYSEALTIYSLQKAKFSDQAQFQDFVVNRLSTKLDGIAVLSKDVITKWEPLDYNVTKIGTYSALIYYEVEDRNAANLGTNEFLLARNVTVAFTYKNEKDQDELFILSLSERGVENELSTKDELLKKMLPILESLQIHPGRKTLQIK